MEVTFRFADSEPVLVSSRTVMGNLCSWRKWSKFQVGPVVEFNFPNIFTSKLAAAVFEGN